MTYEICKRINVDDGSYRVFSTLDFQNGTRPYTRSCSGRTPRDNKNDQKINLPRAIMRVRKYHLVTYHIYLDFSLKDARVSRNHSTWNYGIFVMRSYSQYEFNTRALCARGRHVKLEIQIARSFRILRVLSNTAILWASIILLVHFQVVRIIR